MKVFVTGVRGFIGGRLAKRLHDAGHCVSGSGSSPRREHEIAPWLVHYRTTPLAADPDPRQLEGHDWVIHCAHSPGPGQERLNIAGTRRMTSAARAAGVHQQVFLSSFSAREDATHGYGFVKHELEQHFASAGWVVVRPGLVLGDGGLFRRLVGVVRRFPVIPVPGGGRRPVPVVGIADFLQATCHIVETDAPGSFSLCYETRPPLVELLDLVAQSLHRGRLFLSLPDKVVRVGLALASLCGLRLGVDAGNLAGYASGCEVRHVSRLAELLPEHSSVQSAVSAAVDEVVHGRRGAT